MVTKKDITDMYVHLRKTNQSISDEALEFMKATCMKAIEETTESHTCTDFAIYFSDMKMRSKKVIQPPNGTIF